MKYAIDEVIKRLQDAQGKGKKLITESELIQIATPKINNIDEVIKLVEKAIEKINAEEAAKASKMEISVYPLLKYRNTFAKTARITSISRQTLYRWKNSGIIEIKHFFLKDLIDLIVLRDNLRHIKETFE